MNHYYRITAYHKNSNVCLIADSNGKFEKLWQFSSFFVCKGFEIISVAKEDNLSFGNIPNPPVSLPKNGGKHEKRLAVRQVFFWCVRRGSNPDRERRRL